MRRSWDFRGNCQKKWDGFTPNCTLDEPAPARRHEMRNFYSLNVWIMPLLMEKNGGNELHEKIQNRRYPACIIAGGDGDGTDSKCGTGFEL